MSDEAEILKKRFIELAKKSHGSGIFLFSDFLGLAEQSIFDSVRKSLGGANYTLFGGAAGAERVMVRFGDPEELLYEVSFPITLLKIEPKSQKFADKLTHRDFLGAILNLGIERTVLGDIVIRDNVAFAFARDDIAEYIRKELFRVRNTEVNINFCDTLPDGELYRTEEKTVQISSERLDAVIARVYNLSREDAQRLFLRGLVFASGRQIDSTCYTPKENEKISVRGLGRFIYRGYVSSSKKGKLNVLCELYV